MHTTTVLFWRRLDLEGLERLELTVAPDAVVASGVVMSLEGGGVRVAHRWELDADWRARSLAVERWSEAGHAMLRVERDGDGWRVDGARRPDLDGAEEPDLSVTPFCNTLPIRRTPAAPGPGRPLDVAFVDGVTLAVARSRQRYDRQGPGRLRFVDLGLSRGFEADLVVDGTGLVLHYEGLFERVAP
ncbi:putative glycolipid-binding domain-containing protein [Roseisolibacter sp. H3M3-2]|uniref:putative glycolipid-binding domain-containing protein n=1 Tax=Roseisolibacter sp. H3M3-2 TaxID=3031323 RepID=UPI0023D9D0A8|nr:putative glycolipid-binding domain-containing protein [Roseisolibacter sp. H3M3-2]MDF1503222.1 putative glycolipid-binding domain-containing protein [Roseisolibacter sp. H3M3-2]